MENLTYARRTLWEKVQSEFRYKWIKNGKIFVRDHESGRSIKILTEKDLQNALSSKQLPQKEHRSFSYRKSLYTLHTRNSHTRQPPPFPFRNRSSQHVPEPPPYPFGKCQEVLLADYFPSSFFSTRTDRINRA